MAIKDKKTEVKMVLLEKTCECGGNMVFDTVSEDGGPTSYRHNCDACGSSAMFDKQYPILTHEKFELIERLMRHF